jgi:metal-responsive CopG/Arc/MetJ family transcriptional regulator
MRRPESRDRLYYVAGVEGEFSMGASIILPPTMLREIERLAEREGRTVSELLQEAVRRYLIQSQVRELQRYGKQKSVDLAADEGDVERLIHEYRRERRERHTG